MALLRLKNKEENLIQKIYYISHVLRFFFKSKTFIIKKRVKCIKLSNLKTKFQFYYPFKKYLEINHNFYDFSLKSAHFFKITIEQII